MNPLKVVFMGSPNFAVPVLDEIVRIGHQVICVYSQPPRPSGRGVKQMASPVHKFAESKGLKIKTPKSFTEPNQIGEFQRLEADIVVVVAYGLILPVPILEAPRFGCINLHTSLLPRWRGAAPIQRAIEAGDEVTGICIIRMNEKLDEGPIIFCEEFPICNEATSLQVHKDLSVLSVRMIGPVLKSIGTGNYKVVPQSKKGVTYARKLSKHEGRLVWGDSAEVIERKIRAFSPWPGTWFEYGGEKIKVLAGQTKNVFSAKNKPPGTVVDDKLTIMCGSGTFRPLIIQRAGKREMDLDQFLRGYNISKGERLS